MTLKLSDLYSCASNNTYGQCCMIWHELHKVQKSIIEKHVMPFVNEKLTVMGNDVIKYALGDIYRSDFDEAIDQEALLNDVCTPWVVFNWVPMENLGLFNFNPIRTIVENYQIINKNKLHWKEKWLIQQIEQSYYSFYRVSEIDQLLRLHDILLDMTHAINKQQLSCNKGDIIFGCIVKIQEHSILMSSSLFLIPPEYYYHILDFKRELESIDSLSLTPCALRDAYSMLLIGYFLEIINEPITVLD
jgi:hypothetical protein